MAFVQSYDDLMNGPLAEYIGLSNQIGSLVKLQSDMVVRAVNAQREFLVVAAASKSPSQDVLISLLKPTSDKIQEIQSFREKNRASEYFNHLSTISESITALGWVTVSPTPGPFVKEMTDASQFYANKVLMAFKDKDRKQVDWAKAWVAFLMDLQKYIKQFHTTGLMWNARGSEAKGAAFNGGSAGGGPPPPPPPPPRGFLSDAGSSAGASGDSARLELLKDLNKGTNITSGLKKVTAEQQSHKNPALRTLAPAPYKGPAGGALPKSGKGYSPPPKPPKFELEGRKFMVEYQQGTPGGAPAPFNINITEMSQSVSIYKCKDIVVIVKGKVNSITMDSCSKVGIVFDNVVSFVELINCQNVQAQAMGSVPTINAEKTDVAQIFLNQGSMYTEIVTAKSSSVNVSVPDSTGDFREHPIPEQFKSIWTGKGFKTAPADMTG